MKMEDTCIYLILSLAFVVLVKG